jgi:16S rRNA (guanine(966)-N(2))-methyltransferase RsmD
MRISGGSAKGRKVGVKKAFSNKGDAGELRPTSAKVRQAIFNILGNRIIGARFLDLYAGTGAVGIEALSRGADEAVFIDDNSVRTGIIKDLIEKFGFRAKSEIIKEDASRFLKKTDSVFDIIFVDPPYASGELEAAMSLIDEREVLRDNGVVIAEHSSKKKTPQAIGGLRLAKTYKYGDTSLSLYIKEKP